MSGLKVTAIVAGPDGKAIFSQVVLPDDVLDGVGQYEPRPRRPMNEWHTAAEGKATIIVVVRGKWEVEVASGETRTFRPGAIVVSQDGALEAANGHRSRNAAQTKMRLLKNTVDQIFDPVS